MAKENILPLALPLQQLRCLLKLSYQEPPHIMKVLLELDLEEIRRLAPT